MHIYETHQKDIDFIKSIKIVENPSPTQQSIDTFFNINDPIKFNNIADQFEFNNHKLVRTNNPIKSENVNPMLTSNYIVRVKKIGTA